jgi:hypothetical protein
MPDLPGPPYSGPSPFPPPQPAPLGVGGLFDRIFHLLRHHLRLFLRIAAPPAVLLLVLIAALGAITFLVLHPVPAPPQPAAPAQIAEFLALSLAVDIAFLLVYAVFEAAATYAALQAHAGIPVSCREAYGFAQSKVGRYIWLQILRILLVSIPAILIVGLSVLAAIAAGLPVHQHSPNGGFTAAAVLGIGYLVALVLAVLALLRLALAFPAAVAEDRTAWNAAQRSLELTQGAKGRIFLVALLVWFLSYAVFLLLEVGIALLALFGVLAGRGLHLHTAWLIAGVLVLGLILLAAILLWSALTWTAYAIMGAVLYQDQRFRLEGVAPAPMPAS